MVAGFVERVAKVSFLELQSHVDEVLAEMPSGRIVSFSEASPLDLQALRQEAKAAEANKLFLAYTEYMRAHDAYLGLCRSLGFPGTATDKPGTILARTFISNFHVVQSLWRKLKDGEYRASVCAAAKRAASTDVPASSMLALQHKIQHGPPDLIDAASASARDACAESVAAESVGVHLGSE